MEQNDFDFFDDEQDGRYVQGVRKLGTSFILLISALLSISFYVTAGKSVFSWMPQEWMAITSAIVLGLTGNELAVSFWLTVRSRAKQLTNEQASVVQGGIVAGWITSLLTTLAAFIVTPETSPEFLAEYAPVIAFGTMTIPIIIQMSLVVAFLSFSREAEIATKKAQNWGDSLKTWSGVHQALNRATLHEAQLEARRQLPDFARQKGQHEAGQVVTRGLASMRAAKNVPDSDIVTFEVDAPAPVPMREEKRNTVEVLVSGQWRHAVGELDRTEALGIAQNYASQGKKSRVVCAGKVVITYEAEPGIIQGTTPNGRPL